MQPRRLFCSGHHRSLQNLRSRTASRDRFRLGRWEEALFVKYAAALLSAAAFAAMACASPVLAEDTARAVNPFAGNPEAAKEGASLFNQYCSHCHGPWADQAERARDLRRLHIRYGDDAISMFYSTVTNGRMDKGMPVWKGVLDDAVLWKIFTFLETVQVED
jgi:mono/diheme cytochrome c family protein